MGLNISPSIWQSHINTILDCLQCKKYCKAIMDDLLLFIPTRKSHIAILEDLLKGLLKNGLKISPISVNSLDRNYNVWEILYLLRIGDYVLNCYEVG